MPEDCLFSDVAHEDCHEWSCKSTKDVFEGTDFVHLHVGDKGDGKNQRDESKNTSACENGSHSKGKSSHLQYNNLGGRCDKAVHFQLFTAGPGHLLWGVEVLQGFLA